MKFYVRAEDGSQGFVLDVDDDKMAALRAYATANAVTEATALKMILEHEVGRLHAALNNDQAKARETFDRMSDDQLLSAHGAFTADCLDAKMRRAGAQVAFCEGRLAVLEELITGRGLQVPKA